MTGYIESQNLYHSPREPGFWTSLGVFDRASILKDGRIIWGAVPVNIRDFGNGLDMVFSTPRGEVIEPISQIPVFEVVEGNSAEYPHEKDGELLVQIHYLKVDQMETKPRRIRPTAIKFGIHGEVKVKDGEIGSSHREQGESADYYLEGHDTQYDPGKDGNADIRRFPFWRIGVWGNPEKLAGIFLPEPQGEPLFTQSPTRAEFEEFVDGLVTEKDRKLFGERAKDFFIQALLYPTVFAPAPATFDSSAYAAVIDDVVAEGGFQNMDRTVDPDRIDRLLTVSLELGIVEMNEDGRLIIRQGVQNQLNPILALYDE